MTIPLDNRRFMQDFIKTCDF